MERDAEDCQANDAEASSAEQPGQAKSKQAQKRERAAERWAEQKRLKKERKKARKSLDQRPPRREGGAVCGDGAGGSGDSQEAPKMSRIEYKKEKKLEYVSKCQTNFSVVIDCAWDSHLVGRPLKSLAQQILFCYGMNRRVDNPCNMCITGVNARLREQLDKNSLANWIGVHVNSEEYIEMACFSASSSSSSGSSGAADGEAESSSSPPRVKRLVYLTSDAEETLESIEPDTAYIIGGIVDRNSLKGATAQKAKTQGIRAVKLPIKEHVAMASSHVLTVNHVFQLLLEFQRCGSWAAAIARVLPQRKGATLKSGGGGDDGDGDVDGDGDGSGHSGDED